MSISDAHEHFNNHNVENLGIDSPAQADEDSGARRTTARVLTSHPLSPTSSLDDSSPAFNDLAPGTTQMELDAQSQPAEAVPIAETELKMFVPGQHNSPFQAERDESHDGRSIDAPHDTEQDAMQDGGADDQVSLSVRDGLKSENLERRESCFLRDTCSGSFGRRTYTWGRGDMGQLGSGENRDIFLPSQPDALKNRQVVAAAANLFNTIFILDDGDLLICGNNDNHQLGFKPKELKRSDSMSDEAHSSVYLSRPQRVGALEAFTVHCAAMGSAHAVAVVADGSLAVWGCNEFGQLGLQEQGDDVTHPKLVKRKGKPYVRVAAGDSHTLSLTSNGRVFSTGNNAFGQLGHSTMASLAGFKEVEGLWPLGIIQVSCGDNHSAALAADGRLYTWGRGKYGQLGTGDFANANSPRLVDLPAKAIQVASGGDHTLVATAGGQVFSWGMGVHGQLGHGDATNIAVPKLVEGLAEREAVQVSAGSQHSLVLTESGQVWAFGSNAHGQLGQGEAVQSCFSPESIICSDRPAPPSFVLAAGEHSICLCTTGGRAKDKGLMPRGLVLPCLQALAKAASNDSTQMALLQSAVVDIFENPGYLVAYFATQSYDPKADGLQLELNKIQEVYVDLLKVRDQSLVECMIISCGAAGADIGRCYEASTSRVPSTATSLLDVRLLLRALFILFQNPLNQEAVGRLAMRKIIHAMTVVLEASQASADLFKSWLKNLPAEVFRSRALRPLQRQLSFVAMRQSSTASRGELMEALRILEYMYQANDPAKPSLPLTDFQNLEISEGLDLVREYSELRGWLDELRRKPSAVKELKSVCQMPFCLNPQAKSRVFQTEAAWEKQMNVHNGALQAMLLGDNPVMHQYLILAVRREALLRDALIQISSKSNHLKKPLKVIFTSNGVQEEGVDQGGVTKEFFQLLMRQVFEEVYGMFVLDEETRNFWFNFTANDSQDEFKLVGWLVGLAVYNDTILDIRFPKILYKKLNLQTHEEMGFQDLKESFPGLGQGLQQLLDFEGDVESTFVRNFEVEYDYFGELKRQPLKPGGCDIPLTNANRDEYVRLYTQWKLHDSISTQFNAFAEGFREVCNGPSLRMFRSDELELLICGLPELNFEDLQAVARYDGGYNQEHPTVKALWSCLHAYPLEQKKLFLKFTTGCDRAPVGGLANLVLVIQKSGPDSESLPTAHTCFNYLLLPEYCSQEKLEAKLRTAINNAEGFGLQ